ncbi:MAG: FAD-dependent thymidylate synthase [Candidatus Kapabacteria bacterium]|nr:FAD-dependent thymidylate synthase [Candidatus Kapabacteria bacterium]MDW8012631.1 FAD-dependent thymidylate synthase [Bacteroidota bacterium]
MRPEVAALLGKEFRCLDKGFVRLVDVMGDDAAVVQAARVSYGEGTRTVSDDRKLIRYLMRHRHTSPFEMVEFKFHVKLPIFVARQWIRHRTANVNEYSGRYSVMREEFYVPELSQLRPQHPINKQGRAEEPFPLEIARALQERIQHTQAQLYAEYQFLLQQNLARELARITLPLSVYTEWYWKIDLHNLFHFLRLRLDDHAQYELRVYAQAIAEIVKVVVPLCWEAFEDYVLNALTFSRLEQRALARLLRGEPLTEQLLEESGLQGREAREFRAKVHQILSMNDEGGTP